MRPWTGSPILGHGARPAAPADRLDQVAGWLDNAPRSGGVGRPVKAYTVASPPRPGRAGHQTSTMVSARMMPAHVVLPRVFRIIERRWIPARPSPRRRSPSRGWGSRSAGPQSRTRTARGDRLVAGAADQERDPLEPAHPCFCGAERRRSRPSPGGVAPGPGAENLPLPARRLLGRPHRVASRADRRRRSARSALHRAGPPGCRLRLCRVRSPRGGAGPPAPRSRSGRGWQRPHATGTDPPRAGDQSGVGW